MHSIFLSQPRRASTPSPTLAPQTSPPPSPRLTATPVADWPFWTRTIAKFRHPKDAGLGDTIVHLIGDTRSERFKKWFARKFEKTCGCTQRQRWLNQKFPYA